MENQPTQSTIIPDHLQKQIDKMREEGATVGIPLVIQFGERELAAVTARGQAAKPMTFGEDLARFSAKAGIATVFAAGGALVIWFMTKPADPMT